MEQRKLIAIPFEGFYNSITQAELEDQEEDWEDFIDPIGSEAVEPPEVNWKDLHNKVSEIYTQHYNAEFLEKTGIDLKLQFEKLFSPREYNFGTDVIYAYADEGALNKVIAKIGLAKIRKELREAYAPRDGFMPFNSTLVSIEDKPKNFPDLFFKDVILELLFDSDVIYNSDSYLTSVRESYYQV